MAKAPLNTYLEKDLLERARDAVVAFPGDHPTLTSLFNRAVQREVARLERKHGSIPKRKRELPTGRRAS